MNKKRDKRNILKIGTYIVILILGIIFCLLYFFTGFLQSSKIDERDIALWNYENNTIQGIEAFSLEGSRDTCWLLVHSYTSTPLEMKEISERINSEFGDFVRVPRLKGHGEVPSKIVNLSLEDWYNQIEEEFIILNETCGKINVLGSSFGGAISVRLSEDYEFNNLYLLNAYLLASKKWYSPFPSEVYINLLANKIKFTKKNKLARINDLESLKTHVAYWNMPLMPVKNSFPFIYLAIDNLNNIGENVFIAHSKNDVVASYENAENIYYFATSEVKELYWYDESDHILLKDYQREKLIKDILNFEKRNR